MDHKPFAGRHALVTGGGSGLGLACARRLAEQGAAVTICGRTEAKLEEAATSIGHGVRTTACDIRNEDQVAAAVAFAAEPDGALHVAVVNAGGGYGAGPVIATELEGWTTTIDTNVTGSMLTIKYAARAIARSGGGAIVAISSIAGGLTHRHIGSYCVSKAALEMLVRNAADELGPFNVRVNAVRPGLVPTDASDILYTDPYTHADYLAQMPLGRVGTPEDVAAAVSFLASDEANWITGQILGVDGGHSLRRGPDLDPLIGSGFAETVDELIGRRPV